jgi:RHS repeat-associated protein
VKWTHYYTFNGQRVAVRDGASGPVSWLHGDLLGSASVASNSSGGKIANSEQRFTPYGTPRLNASGLPTDKTFTGQRVENALGGIMDFNARYYDPTLGRFLSADTIYDGGLANPQGLNRYSYVKGRPAGHDRSVGTQWRFDLHEHRVSSASASACLRRGGRRNRCVYGGQPSATDYGQQHTTGCGTSTHKLGW